MSRRLFDIAESERRVLRLAMPPVRALWPAIAFGTLSALCAVGLLATSALLITRASLTIHILLLGIPIVAVRAFAVFRAVFRYVDRLSGHDASFRQLSELRTGLLDRLIPLAPAGLGTTRRGDLISRLVDDVDELQFLPLRVVEPLVIAVIAALGTVIGVAFLHPGAALILLAALVSALVVATLAQLVISGRADRAVAPLRAELGDRIYETVTRLEVLRAYDALDAALERVSEADAALRRALVRRSIGEGVVSGAITLFAGLAVAGALAVGIDPVAGQTFPPEYLTLIALVPLALFEVFAALPQAVASWRRVRVSAQRIADVAPETVPEGIPLDGSGTGAHLPEGPLSLRLRHFTVRRPVLDPEGAGDPEGTTTRDDDNTSAPDRREPVAGAPISRVVIDDLDLDVPAGTHLLVTGDSGAGKTTLADALVRFLDYEGSYLIGGLEARELDPVALRRGIGLVEQRAHLFDNSIRQNLLFAHDDATDDQLESVLDRVGLGEWMRERGGLDAPVGERGALVSGGQAQRLSLARGILADFRILILDEPTANVDPGRADALIADLLGAVEDRTVILISHTPVDESLVTARLRLRASDAPVVPGPQHHAIPAS